MWLPMASCRGRALSSNTEIQAVVQIHTNPSFREQGRWGSKGPEALPPASLRPQEFQAGEPASGRRGRTEAAQGPTLLAGLSAPGPSGHVPHETARQGLASELNHQPPSFPTLQGDRGAPLPRTDSTQVARPDGGEAGGPAAQGPPAASLPRSSAPGPADTGGALHPTHSASPASCSPRLHVVLASSWLLLIPGRLVHAVLTWLGCSPH